MEPEIFGHIFHRKKRVLARIEGINKELERNWSHALVSQEYKLRSESFDILRQEEVFWYQKSRRKWIKDGDCNTRFFHLYTMIRRKRNKIDRLQLQNENGLKTKKN